MTGVGLLPAVYGLAAAMFWGSGDFAGGLASRRTSAYRVVLTAEWIGLLLLLPFPFIFSEPLPAARDLLLSAVASLGGVFGLVMLYQAMAEGKMSLTAPVSALLAVIIPMLVGGLTEGFPGFTKLAGFMIAMAAIWLISSVKGDKKTLKMRLDMLRMPLAAGLTFGAYFVLLHAASQEAIFWPLISARLASTAGLLIFLAVKHQPVYPPRQILSLAGLCGGLDTAANACYVLAGQTGRLDMAAVLSSLYPGITIILAWIMLKERVDSLQAAGILTALLAIFLITV